jgi:DNA-binding CsgD family transcriptional regulator
MSSWNLDLAKSAFADAAVGSGSWRDALDTVTEVTESFGAVLLPIKGDLIPNIPFSERTAPSLETYLRDGWYERDERHNGIHIMTQRGVVDDLDISTFDRIKCHPYYQEFLAPHDLRWYAGVRVMCGEDLWCLSIQRRIEQGPFSPSEKQRLAKLSDSLSTSAALARALGGAAADAALEAFELSGKAVVLVNRNGEVFKANASAERLLSGEVHIAKRKLVAKDGRATAMLDRAIHDLLWHGTGAGLSPPIALPRDGARPLLAYPARLPRVTASALADCQGAIVLVDPDQRSQPAVAALQVAFNLTGSEARLAARLATGQSLDDITGQIGIAKETGRSQLKSIFEKVGVHRQNELVAVLSSLPA